MNVSMTSMFVPDPVISLSLLPKTKETINFSKALNRFQKEDPTFRVHLDVERMKREYGVECETGEPQVAFRETITKRVEFNYTHKKQTGGAGQFARVKNIRMVLQDGLTHIVDSSEMAFRAAGFSAFREAFQKAAPIVLEPIMKVEISCPVEFQGNVMGSINRRKGVICDSETHVDYFSATQGKGEFSMEYKQHAPVNMGTQKEIIDAFLKAKGNKK